jgi:large subunit ribosomal protein L24|tara:strand:- start:408 stop:737 length:330 start_codon:yes stop_codon:yes gene_type:complete
MKRIKKGDLVIVLTGKSKGGKGRVTAVIGEKILVEGQNIVKKHVKPNPNAQEQGGIKEMSAPIHVSNVALVNPATEKADRVGFKFVDSEDGAQIKKRFFKSDGELVDIQ